MEDKTTADIWWPTPSGRPGGDTDNNNVLISGGTTTTLISLHSTTQHDLRTTPDDQFVGQSLFNDIQVPYIVIIWVVALASSIFSIALCCLCSQLQKRAQRLRQRRNRPEPSQETKNDQKQNQTPIKIANPLSCRDSCAICCEPYSGGDNDIIIGYVRPCGHYFHQTCAWRWISVRETCPLCRYPVSLRKSEMTGMTLKELEELLGVPNGTLRRQKKKGKAELSMIDETNGRLKTISLTMNLPVMLQSTEIAGSHSSAVILHNDS